MINYCFSNTKPPPRYWLSKVTFRYYISIAKSLALLLITYVEMLNSYAGIEFQVCEIGLVDQVEFLQNRIYIIFVDISVE